MIKLEVKHLKDREYKLIDENNNEYKILMDIYDYDVEKNNIKNMYIHENALKEVKNRDIQLGELGSIYGRKVTSSDSEEIVILELINNERITFKRLYG